VLFIRHVFSVKNAEIESELCLAVRLSLCSISFSADERFLVSAETKKAVMYLPLVARVTHYPGTGLTPACPRTLKNIVLAIDADFDRDKQSFFSRLL
jgi:hypothetical protein